MKLNLLAFGAHPDDVELSCSGILLREIARGQRVGIVDLTEGELGTRGTVAQRYAESAAAAKILGVQHRENLRMRDGFFLNDEAHQKAVISVLRRFQPEIVLCNAPDDRHPDHGRGARLLVDACFLSGLRQIETLDESGVPQAPWRPSQLFHYVQDRWIEPHLVVDVTPVWEQRMESVKAYTSQFHSEDSKEPVTYISDPEFLHTVEARARQMGKRIGVKFGEGLISPKGIGLPDLSALLLTPA